MLRGWFSSTKSAVQGSANALDFAAESQSRKIYCSSSPPWLLIFSIVEEAMKGIRTYKGPSKDCISDAHLEYLAVTLIMNDDLEGAEAGLSKGDSSYHKVGLSLFPHLFALETDGPI